MITVACVWVKGHVPYTAEYVAKLRSMVARNLERPHRFICLTDRARDLPTDLETAELAAPLGCYAWWAKVSLFSPRFAPVLRGRCLYLDLDSLIVAPLDPIVDYPADMALAPDTANFPGKGARKTVHRFNSSVMVWNGGCEQALWDKWSWGVTERLYGDQDHISEQRPDAAAMPRNWFPRISEIAARPPEEAKVLLVKTPKNVEAAERWPWFREAWA